MSKFKTANDGRAVSLNGELRLCEEIDGWKRKVELWLLNGETNRNNWRYENIEAHRKLFAETPILVAYVGNRVGDGHNFDEMRDEYGNVAASFMSATAERIVGFFKTESDIRIEERDGKKWIVGTGYIWKWYAQELVKKLEEQGLRGMAVSIETLIDELHMDGSTEVFTRYQILGTTILGDGVSPAVADANIRTLSAIGAEKVKEMALRVASEQEKKADNNQSANKNLNKKGKRTMTIKELSTKFAGCTVLGVNGANVALISEKGVPCVCKIEKDNGEILTGAKTEIAVNAVFGEGEEAVSVSVEELCAAVNSEKDAISAELAKEKELREAAEKALNTMQKAENSRRVKAVKEAIKARLDAIKESTDAEIEDCADLMTDEKLAEYAAMENAAGEFVGDAAACKDVDNRCMAKILDKANAMRKNTYAWDTASKNVDDNSDAISSLLNRTMKNR